MHTHNDLIYQIALTCIPHIGDVHAKMLVNTYGDASSVFKAPARHLEKIEGIGSTRAAAIKRFKDFSACENEMLFMEKYRISPLFIKDPSYPQRLLNCYDSPVLLFYRGTADLNHSRIISVVGTRNNTDYGRQVCEKLIEELRHEQVMVISGLAFGIDTITHRAALKHHLPTIGVLAHGLDRIYPHQNKSMAKKMTAAGGLLTDFKRGTNPDKQNFPKRNRLVAGMCDALVVVESAQKGGSLITAELANSYNKDVFAFPGRTTDPKSDGCNYLIRHNKAQLLCSAQDLLEMMNWQATKAASVRQRELFVELTTQEKTITDILSERPASIDELYLKSKLSSSEAAQALLMLEMQGIVQSLPGKMYRLS